MEKLPTWKYLRESVGAELYSAGENEEIAKGLYGLSGGGVFDSAGNLIGIHLGQLNAGRHIQHRIARIELFRRNWESLVQFSKVEELDSDEIASVSHALGQYLGRGSW